MSTLTDQETFDKVCQHLSDQGKKALGPPDSNGGTPLCLYRAPDGSKCAVGCLIPDDKYTPVMENMSISSLDGAHSPGGEGFLTGERKDLQEKGEFLGLLGALQNIHDVYAIREWKAELQSQAHLRKLNTTLLDTLPFTEKT